MINGQEWLKLKQVLRAFFSPFVLLIVQLHLEREKSVVIRCSPCNTAIGFFHVNLTIEGNYKAITGLRL